MKFLWQEFYDKNGCVKSQLYLFGYYNIIIGVSLSSSAICELISKRLNGFHEIKFRTGFSSTNLFYHQREQISLSSLYYSLEDLFYDVINFWSLRISFRIAIKSICRVL